MRMRLLGRTGLRVSEIGFGGWQLGNAADWDVMEDRTAHRLVRAARDGGINLFDTAPNYAAGHGERLLGEALAGRRHDCILVSKVGHTAEGGADFSVEGLRSSLDASLRRLRTDYLDVLLVHNPPPSMYDGSDPLWHALEEERSRGRIRHYGASLDHAAELEAGLAHTASEVFEIRFNIFHQEVRSAFPALRARGAGTIVKTPLDSGWLAGGLDAARRFRGTRARWTPEQIARRAGLVAELEALTAGAASRSAVALGFLLSYDEVGCVIPGMRTLEHLRENLAASGARVSPAERARLEAFWETATSGGSHALPW